MLMLRATLRGRKYGFALAESASSATTALVPTLVNFSGMLSDENGKPLSGNVGVTFFLHKDQQGGAPCGWKPKMSNWTRPDVKASCLVPSPAEVYPAMCFLHGCAGWAYRSKAKLSSPA
jgi:hypothetical protein